mgnify:CR=1 FL=1
MNPYKIDINLLKESKKIKDEKDLVKLQLVSELCKIISKMETADILEQTGLDKSDLSRLRSLDFKRFSIDRIITILNDLGFSAKVSIVRLNKAS